MNGALDGEGRIEEIKEDDEKERKRERERERVDASSSQFRGVSGPKPVCPPQVPSVYTSVRAHLRRRERRRRRRRMERGRSKDAEATHVSSRVCAFMQFVTRGTGIPPLK